LNMPSKLLMLSRLVAGTLPTKIAGVAKIGYSMKLEFHGR